MCGGGVYNLNIIDYMREYLLGMKIYLFDDVGIFGGVKEVVMFVW